MNSKIFSSFREAVAGSPDDSTIMIGGFGNAADKHQNLIAVLEVAREGLVLRGTAPGWTPEEVQAYTEPEMLISRDLKEIEL